MQDSMYSAMFGALTQEHRLDIIANNLANTNTHGYKSDRLAFKDTFIKYAHDEIREPMMNIRSQPMFPEPDYIAKPRIATSQVDFTQGAVERSDNNTDMAISGEGFFKVRTLTGDYYTRNGSFRLDSQGTLVNGNGYMLLGGGGPINIPPGVNPIINEDGTMLSNGEVIGRVDLVTVENLSALEKVGQNLYRIKEGANTQEIPAEDAKLQQGYLERPNVEVVNEMVNMIEAQRAYEAYTKIIQQTDMTDKKVISEVGVVR